MTLRAFCGITNIVHVFGGVIKALMKISRSVICLILSALTMFFAVSCQNDSKSVEPSEQTTASCEKEDDIVINTYEKNTVRLNQNTPGIKILGVRNLKSEAVINADWTCSGIEFYADCEGTLTLRLASQTPCYYRAYVDGEPYMNGDTPYFTVDQSSMIELENIAKGEHLFRFVKATGYTLAKSTILSVTLNGLISNTAPKDNDLYLEFVGDSICCGWGVLPDANGEYNGTYQSQDGTLAYPYLISTALNADYSVTALSGQGLSCGKPGMVLGYNFACYEKESEAEYDFARKADAVIINIGTNDYSKRADLGITEQDYFYTYKSFLTTVREKNGANCKIILVYNVMNDTFANSISLAARSLGGEDAGYYLLRADRTKKERGNSHPSQGENVKYAEKIGSFIKEVLKIQ